MKVTKEQFVGKLERQLTAVQGRIEKFASEVVKNPAHIMSWSTSTFKDAAEHSVLSRTIADLNNGSSIEDVMSFMLDIIVNKSKYPPSSSSVTSNMIDQYELAATSDLYSNIKNYFEI